ncbi:MAG: NAD-dependent protein deacylase, partial [Anaerolineae bacterium]
GEMPYHMGEIDRQLAQCDLFIAVGTSGQVYPAAGFVREAVAAGAHTIEVNRESSGIAGWFAEQRLGLAGQVMPDLVETLLAR